MGTPLKSLIVLLTLSLGLTSCTLMAPEEEKRIRESLNSSDIAYERLHRSFKGGTQYAYRLTLNDDSIDSEAIIASLQAFSPNSSNTSLTITNQKNDYSIKFYGGGESDTKEAKLLAEFIKENKASIAELHYVEPPQEAIPGEKLRTVIEFNGELDGEGIIDAISISSVFTGGTVLYFNSNKITLIGEPDRNEVTEIAESLSAIHESIESKSPNAEEYDYNITAVVKNKEITITKNISDDVVIDKNALRSISLPPGWTIKA